MDTLKTSTNEDGLFFFKNVKAWEFTLSIRSLGYGGFVKLGKYNDADALLTMDPIILTEQPTALAEIIIDGTPSIVYKVDTVEYKAADYQVREGAAVEELLKKMEGMQVDKKGQLYYNGTIVAGARLNGKNFLDGEVSNVTKNLPAEIVSKVQIINDFGDQAARSGIKDGPSEQVLNITTKADRSLGYFTKMNGELGNDSRYNGDLTGVRIDGNRNIALIGKMSNTVIGVPTDLSGIIGNTAESGLPGAGNTNDQAVGFSYRDQWSPKTQANMNYSFNAKDVNSKTSSIIQDFSTTGITTSNDDVTEFTKSNGHRLRFEIENSLDSANFLKISTDISYASTNNEDRVAKELSGLIRQNQEQNNLNRNNTPAYAIEALYQRLFRKKGRNFTANLSGSIRDQSQDRNLRSSISYFDLLTNATLKDSVIHRLMERRHRTNVVTSSLTYTEPLGRNSAFQLLGLVTRNGYDNKTFASNAELFGTPILIDSLSNMFKYSFTQGRIGLNYKYFKKRYDISVGAAAVPVLLKGNNLSSDTPSRRMTFNILPIFRMQYSWTLQQQVTITYSGNPIEPFFSQVQPIKDVSNPQSPIVGNPDLKTAFIHVVNSRYNNYYPNSQLGLNAGLTMGLYRNKVVSNITQVADAYNSLIYEKSYFNTNGSYYLRGNYRLSKQFSDRKYGVSLSGTADHHRNIGRSNNAENIQDQWTFENAIFLRANPSDNFEINPSFSYTVAFSDNTLPSIYNTELNVFCLNVDGLAYLMRSWLVGYSVSKNFVNGSNSTINHNPFIVNSYFEKEFFKKKSLKARIEAFDIFNQNRFVNRTFAETSFTDTRTSSQSRYFKISIIGTLQRWKGTPSRNGQKLQRRGDGSFIYR